MFALPEGLERGLADSGGAGRRWIEALPSVLDDLSARWGIELCADHAPLGDWNLVLLAHRDGQPCAVKVCGPDQDAADEIAALRAWNGRGAVRLLAATADHSAMLLERLDQTRSLRGVALAEAAAVAGSLIAELAIAAPAGLLPLVDIAHEIATTLGRRQRVLGNPLPARWVDHAIQLAGDLATDPGSHLVHGDLHYDNILAGTRREWLAVDPKPTAGNTERCVAELMWDRIEDASDADEVRDLFSTLVDAADLDRDRSHAWTIVRAVDYWLWGLGAGLTEDPVRCHRLLDTLLA